jgi:hypothetical protein
MPVAHQRKTATKPQQDKDAALIRRLTKSIKGLSHEEKDRLRELLGIS